jgi:hypothetical protein
MKQSRWQSPLLATLDAIYHCNTAFRFHVICVFAIHIMNVFKGFMLGSISSYPSTALSPSSIRYPVEAGDVPTRLSPGTSTSRIVTNLGLTS